MPQYTDDYGGNAYGGRRRTKRGLGTEVSLRCLDCETLVYLQPRELTRAMRPRCMKCGGASLRGGTSFACSTGCLCCRCQDRSAEIRTQ